MKVKHRATLLIGKYPFHEVLKKEALSLLENINPISSEYTHVKATHTEWNWQPNNLQVIKFKKYILNEIHTKCRYHYMGSGEPITPEMINFWGNVYFKGDYAECHHHLPFSISFSYFLKTKWYDSPLVFNDSGKRIRPKEGTYIIFPSFLEHSVPKHRYNHTRVTLSGNVKMQ